MSVQVSPPVFDMTSRETLPLAFDCTAYLVGGDVVTSPSVSELRDLTTDKVLVYVGSVTVSGNIITVPFTGSVMVAKHQYRLTVQFTAAAGKVWEAELTINCVP